MPGLVPGIHAFLTVAHKDVGSAVKPNLTAVMAGLVPAIHVFVEPKEKQDVDARDKPGHDEVR